MSGGGGVGKMIMLRGGVGGGGTEEKGKKEGKEGTGWGNRRLKGATGRHQRAADIYRLHSCRRWWLAYSTSCRGWAVDRG